MKKHIFSILLACNSVIYSQDTLKYTGLYGDYLGQTPPGDTPVIFAPGIISTDSTLEHSAPAFSPDRNEVFWWLNRPPKVAGGKWQSPMMMSMKRIGDVWTVPEVAQFWGEPVFSFDGKRLYFEYLRTDSGALRNDGPWYAEKQGNNWSKPICVNLISRFPELKFIYQLSITRNGILYFVSYLEGPKNSYGIFRAELINGEYSKPEPLPGSINLGNGILNWTPFIANDESYLLFSSNRRSPDTDAGDIYVSFHQEDGKWTNPISLGEPYNTDRQERFPAVSADGKYLFFTRWISGFNQDVFWVSAMIIDRLREENNIKK